MKKLIIIFAFLLCANTWAQDSLSLSKEDIKLNYIFNHQPKNFTADTIKRPRNNFFHSVINLSTIGGLYYLYGVQNTIGFNKQETDWLAEQTNQLAVAFYLEGNPIIIEKTGGPEGCDEKSVVEKDLNGKRITAVRFCFGCSGAGKYVDEF